MWLPTKTWKGKEWLTRPRKFRKFTRLLPYRNRDCSPRLVSFQQPDVPVERPQCQPRACQTWGPEMGVSLGSGLGWAVPIDARELTVNKRE